jgi:hypothetical protein
MKLNYALPSSSPLNVGLLGPRTNFEIPRIAVGSRAVVIKRDYDGSFSSSRNTDDDGKVLN